MPIIIECNDVKNIEQKFKDLQQQKKCKTRENNNLMLTQEKVKPFQYKYHERRSI